MRLPGQSNKPDIPGYRNNTLIASICKYYSTIYKEKPLFLGVLVVRFYYLFITYIVTSKPNLISVAAGLVHAFIVVLLLYCIFTKLQRSYAYIALFAIQSPRENHEKRTCVLNRSLSST